MWHRPLIQVHGGGKVKCYPGLHSKTPCQKQRKTKRSWEGEVVGNKGENGGVINQNIIYMHEIIKQ